MTFWQVDEHTLTSRQDCQCCVSVVSLWLCSLPLMGFGDARNVSVGEAKGTWSVNLGYYAMSGTSQKNSKIQKLNS